MTYREELHDFAESNGFDPSDEFEGEEEDEDEDEQAQQERDEEGYWKDYFDKDPRPSDMTNEDARADEERGK